MQTDSIDVSEAGSTNQVLTVREVAALLRVNRNTVYEAFQRGEIPGGQRIGRSIRFSRDVLLLWLRGNDSALRFMKGKS